jgi:hypothetical protein
MRMTKQQFDTAVDLLQQNLWPESELDSQARVFTAACYVIKHRRSIPDDVDWPGPITAELMTELSEFFAGLDDVQRKKLKRIAESLIKGRDEYIH